MSKVKSMKNINHEIIKELPPKNVKLLLILLSISDDQAKAKATQNELANMLNMNRKTINRIIRELAEVRYNNRPLIEKQRNKNRRVNGLTYAINL